MSIGLLCVRTRKLGTQIIKWGYKIKEVVIIFHNFFYLVFYCDLLLTPEIAYIERLETERIFLIKFRDLIV